MLLRAASFPADVNSLYFTNLTTKLQKEDLRLSLYTLCATYGPVLDVVALKTMKMRGQAHVVFRDVQASTQAMRALQGFMFFEMEMVA
jgi:U2 small nuclear ribonucleoprotein B''